MAMALFRNTGLGTASAATGSFTRFEPADGLMIPNCCCCCSSPSSSASAGINGRRHGWLLRNSTGVVGGQAGLQFRRRKEGASNGAFLAPRSGSPGVLHSSSSSSGSRRGVGPRLRDDERRIRRSVVSMGAVIDPHSLAFLADLIDQKDLEVLIDLDPTREIINERNMSQLSEEAIKAVYMVGSLIFTWGCCVFGAMSDKFYDSEEYRKAGGDGTGHWIYDRQDREERAAREEIWSEDLLKEIEEKADEVRQAEEAEKKKKDKEKEVELV